MSQFRLCILRRSIWKPITSQRWTKAVPIWRNTPARPCFWRMHRYDPSWPHISQDSLCSRNRWKKEKMATSRGVDRHFRGPGRQKLRRKGKTSGDATRTADEVSPKDSPSKTAKAESFKGCRPWIETQHVSLVMLASETVAVVNKAGTIKSVLLKVECICKKLPTQQFETPVLSRRLFSFCQQNKESSYVWNHSPALRRHWGDRGECTLAVT